MSGNFRPRGATEPDRRHILTGLGAAIATPTGPPSPTSVSSGAETLSEMFALSLFGQKRQSPRFDRDPMAIGRLACRSSLDRSPQNIRLKNGYHLTFHASSSIQDETGSSRG